MKKNAPGGTRAKVHHDIFPVTLDQAAGGGPVLLRNRCTGTDDGEFQGKPPVTSMIRDS